VFFACRWGINAQGLGARDAGIALSLAFASSAAAILSMALAVVDAGLLLLVRGSRRLVALALLLSLAPLAFLALSR
jgi:hypothetical protein